MYWSSANTEAVNIGGYLVTINDAGEDAWLYQNFRTAFYLWTGYTRPDGITFTWVHYCI